MGNGSSSSSTSKFSKKAFRAILHGDEKKLSKLLVQQRRTASGQASAKRVNLDSMQDAEGNTLLNLAVSMCNRSMCRMLLNHQLSPNCQPDNKGQTPLYKAVLYNQEALAELLLQYGADADYLNPNSKRTVLTEAIQCGHDKLAELLLSNGADVLRQDGDGWSPLHWAAAKGNETLTQYLLEHKGDLTARDRNGTTPLLRAKAEKHDTIVKLMERFFCDQYKVEGTAYTDSMDDILHSESSPTSTDPGPEPDDDDEEEAEEVGQNAKNNKRKEKSKDKRARKHQGKPTKPLREDDLDDEKCCKICFERPMDSVLLNCGHVAVCLFCSQYLQLCPMCSAPIERVSKIYFS
ncbi:Ankyrin repeat domain-containing protein 66 [Balamuthia mandrillaris]